MRFTSWLYISIILFTILSCKKNVNENSLKYYFTTKLAYWTVFPPMNTTCCKHDTIIYYTGTVTYKSGNVVKIEYCPALPEHNYPYGFTAEGVIYPIIDSVGSLTYPDYSSTWGYYFSGGSIKKNGDIQIEMGANLYNRGYHQSITGYKIN